MRKFAFMAVLTVLLAGRVSQIQAQAAGDADKIQGSWTVSAGEKAGENAPAEHLKGSRMTFSAGKFTCKFGDKDTEGTFKLDETTSPRQISMGHDGHQMAGVYKLEGDKLTICVGHGDDRPTEFVSKPGAKVMLLVLKREKS
jgi:uncharacterized protein (TIGR03067 family)